MLCDGSRMRTTIHYVIIEPDSRPDGIGITTCARTTRDTERSVSLTLHTSSAGCDGDGIVEPQHGPSRPLGSCHDEARSSSTGASSSLLSSCHAELQSGWRHKD